MARKSSNIFPVRQTLTDYSNGAVTAGTNKQEWVLTHGGRILAVICHAGGAGVGAGSTIIDVNLDGTTIYTTQANRPTLATASTGEFADGMPDVQTARPGQVLAYDVDARR